jgi:hypothetical protein
MEFFKATIFFITSTSTAICASASAAILRFGYVEEFCAKYDGPAFDPGFNSAPLSEFEPMVRNVFSQVKNSIYVPKEATSR